MSAGSGERLARFGADGQTTHERNRHERSQYSQTLAHEHQDLTPDVAARQENRRQRNPGKAALA